jgi:hypothetical protein
VPDTTDTALIITGTNLAGVSGTITVIADDGAGGRATNTFLATTAADANNEPPILYPLNAATNRVAPINARLTNIVTALDLDGSPYYWFPLKFDSNASNTFFSLTNGQMQVVVVPNTNFIGTARFLFVVSSDPNWISYFQLLPSSQWPPYDWQACSFAFGDTAVSAQGTSFVAQALSPFTDQAVATFTNGIPNSATNNFLASINWGDNVITAGVIASNLSGWKEVRGSHTYTNSGTYPVYVTLQSTIGVDATVVSTAFVPPTLSLARFDSTNVLRWPAWAAAYQLQSQTNLTAGNWSAVTNLSTLVGYENVVTNASIGSNVFFRLKK